MSAIDCPACGMSPPTHAAWCTFHEQNAGKSNPLPLLVLPFAAFIIPFVVVVFPLASAIAIAVGMAVFRAIGQGIHGSSAFWWTFFISIIPFLLALMAEQWAEGFRAYRIGRHLLRVIGVPWLAAQYIIFGPGLFGAGADRASFSFSSFMDQLFSRPEVFVTAIVLLIITHLVGMSFDLNGRRPSSMRDFFRPSESVFAGGGRRPGAPRGTRVTRWMTQGTAGGPRTLSRKLFYAAGLAVAVGVLATIIGKDYDSAILVILRVGLLCAVVFCGAVMAHHALTRKARGLS